MKKEITNKLKIKIQKECEVYYRENPSEFEERRKTAKFDYAEMKIDVKDASAGPKKVKGPLDNSQKNHIENLYIKKIKRL